MKREMKIICAVIGMGLMGLRGMEEDGNGSVPMPENMQGESARVGSKRTRIQARVNTSHARTAKRSREKLNAITKEERVNIARERGLDVETVNKALSRYKQNKRTVDSFRGASGKKLEEAAQELRDYRQHQGERVKQRVSGLKKITEKERADIARERELDVETVNKAWIMYRENHRTAEDFRGASGKELEEAVQELSDYRQHQGERTHQRVSGLKEMAEEERVGIACARGLNVKRVNKAWNMYKEKKRTAEDFRGASGKDLEEAAQAWEEYLRVRRMRDAEKKAAAKMLLTLNASSTFY